MQLATGPVVLLHAVVTTQLLKPAIWGKSDKNRNCKFLMDLSIEFRFMLSKTKMFYFASQ